MSSEEKKQAADGVLFGRLMKDSKPFWPLLGLVFLLDLLATPLALLSPVGLKVVV